MDTRSLPDAHGTPPPAQYGERASAVLAALSAREEDLGPAGPSDPEASARRRRSRAEHRAMEQAAAGEPGPGQTVVPSGRSRRRSVLGRGRSAPPTRPLPAPAPPSTGPAPAAPPIDREYRSVSTEALDPAPGGDAHRPATDTPGSPGPAPAPSPEARYAQPAAQYSPPEYAPSASTEPRYAAPQFAEPQYAEPQYAEPQYAEPQYAQPQYAQPQYAQPQYAQPQYAQPQYAEASYAQPQHAYAAASPGEAPFAPAGHAEAPYGEAGYGRPQVARPVEPAPFTVAADPLTDPYLAAVAPTGPAAVPDPTPAAGAHAAPPAFAGPHPINAPPVPAPHLTPVPDAYLTTAPAVPAAPLETDPYLDDDYEDVDDLYADLPAPRPTPAPVPAPRRSHRVEEEEEHGGFLRRLRGHSHDPVPVAATAPAPRAVAGEYHPQAPPTSEWPSAAPSYAGTSEVTTFPEVPATSFPAGAAGAAGPPAQGGGRGPVGPGASLPVGRAGNGLDRADRELLVRLGVPREWVEELGDGDRFSEVLEMFSLCPQVDIDPDAELIAVVGPEGVVELEAHRTALDLPLGWLPRPVHSLRARRGQSRRAVTQVRKGGPAVAAVEVAGYADSALVAHLLQDLDPDAVIAVVDASVSLDVTHRWLVGLPRVDAIAVDGALEADEPAAVLEFDLPVVRLDGISIDPIGWTALMCASLSARAAGA